MGFPKAEVIREVIWTDKSQNEQHIASYLWTCEGHTSISNIIDAGMFDYHQFPRNATKITTTDDPLTHRPLTEIYPSLEWFDRDAFVAYYKTLCFGKSTCEALIPYDVFLSIPEDNTKDSFLSYV